MDFFKINKIKETLSNYVKVKFDLLKLDLTEHLANILAQMIAYFVIILIASIVVIFLSIALAQYLNLLLQSNSIGFLIVAGLYTILLLIIFYLLKSGKLKAFFETQLMGNINLPADEK